MTETQRAAMQQALEALEDCGSLAATALRAALAEPEPEPESVALVAGHLVSPYGEWKPNFNLKCKFPAESLEWSIPLYFSPPARRPLTPAQEAAPELLEALQVAPQSPKPQEATMSDKDEALRLADALEKAPAHTLKDGTITLYLGGTVVADKAAACLRRQYELAEKYKWQVRDTCTRAERAEAERDALRAAAQQVMERLALYHSANGFAADAEAIEAMLAALKEAGK